MTRALLSLLAASAGLLSAQQSPGQLAAMGAKQLESGNAEAARSAFEQALKLDPAQYEALSGLGFIHYSENRFDEARQLLQRAAAIRSNSFQTRFLLGAVLVQLNEVETAISHLQRAVALNPSHLDARKLLAAQYLQTQRYREAAALLAALPDEESCLLVIEARQGAGDSPAAFRLAQQAAARFPKSSQLASWLGFQLQFAGRYDEARAQLARALDLDPEFAPAYQLMGEVSLKQENYREAITWLERAAARMPEDVETLLGLSRALAVTGQTAPALDALTRAARAAPKDARVQLQLSRLYFTMGDETRAREAAELSIRLRAANPISANAPPSPLRTARPR